MTKITTSEAFAQIDALTTGLDLPLPALEQFQVQIVIDKLELAWKAVKKKHAAYAFKSDEASLNAFMETELKLQLESDRLFQLLASAVARGSETPNFDGTKIEKRPDINIYRTGKARIAIVIECKIIDGASRTVKMYCENGIERYVIGDYGWAYSQGFMLAYVRDGSTLKGHLHPTLKKQPKCATTSLPNPQAGSPHLANSTHTRSFTYPTKGAPNNVPGPIELKHVWLS